jgi:hypothetical protein
VTGYADQRPIAGNTSESGKAQNRRVEVIILPTTVRSNPVAPAVAASPTKAAPVRKLSKDGPSRQPQTQIDRSSVTK